MKIKLLLLALAAIMIISLAGCTAPPITGHAVLSEGAGQQSEAPTDVEDESTTECNDGIDNDLDLVIDLEDPDCDSESDDAERGTSGGSDNVDSEDLGDNFGDDPENQDRQGYCGDGICEGRENCDNCEDCSCDGSAVCHNSDCIVPECNSDDDCVDNDDCNIDKCYFAGGAYAYCSNNEITRRNNRDNDGCCPEGYTAFNDMDCDPVCGNGWCEPGENERLCLEDCEGVGSSSSDQGDGGGDDGGREGPQET